MKFSEAYEKVFPREEKKDDPEVTPMVPGAEPEVTPMVPGAEPGAQGNHEEEE